MKISFATPYRRSSGDREKNIFLFMKYYLQLPLPIEKEVFIIEQDTVQTLGDDTGCKYLRAPNPSHFNRSWGFNLAMKNTDATFICYIDNDVFIPRPNLITAIDYFKTYRFIKPFSCTQLYDVTYEMAARYVNVGDPPETIRRRSAINLASAAFIIHRETAIQYKGMDERFEGWGAEDDAFTKKVECCIKHAIIAGDAFHVNHERGVLDTNQQPRYQNNLNMLRNDYWIPGCPGIQRVINQTNYDTIGLIGKYS